MRTQRNVNIDCLRIISILFVICFHYVFHGRAGIDSTNISIRFMAEVVYHFGELGTSCFILISGFYLEQTFFKPKKIILFLLEIEFYVVISKLVLCAFGHTVHWQIFDFLPLFRDEYWFIHVYLLIYLLQPFLRSTLPLLDQNKLQNLILSQVIIWSLMPSLIYSTLLHGNTESMPYYNRYIWFLIVYIIGYYLSKYRIPVPKRDYLHIAEAKRSTMVIFPFELLVLFIIMGERGLWPFTPTFFWTPNSLLMLLMSIALFTAFRDWKPYKVRKIPREMVSAILGIYLFHDGELRKFLWNEIFPFIDEGNLINYVGRLILVTSLVFLIGLIVDLARQLLEKSAVIPCLELLETILIRRKQLR